MHGTIQVSALLLDLVRRAVKLRHRGDDDILENTAAGQRHFKLSELPNELHCECGPPWNRDFDFNFPICLEYVFNLTVIHLVLQLFSQVSLLFVFLSH